MIGVNTIQYNQSSMIEAMETYLKEHVMIDKGFEVTEVKCEKDTFIISMKEAQEVNPKDDYIQGT